ncbi:hypothetical protein IQ267_23960 [filamentous cyanobacterium LEGE 07170]|nr:hypothetical protein [filamentous cyanobacterium LEGE 07170]
MTQVLRKFCQCLMKKLGGVQFPIKEFWLIVETIVEIRKFQKFKVATIAQVLWHDPGESLHG